MTACQACGSDGPLQVHQLGILCQACLGHTLHLAKKNQLPLADAAVVIIKKYENVRLARQSKPAHWFTCGCWQASSGLICAHIVRRSNDLAAGKERPRRNVPSAKPEPCVCCGWVKRHKHWCIVHKPAEAEPEACPACAKRGRTCVACLLDQRTATVKLCVICGNPLQPKRGFGRFTCASCG